MISLKRMRSDKFPTEQYGSRYQSSCRSGSEDMGRPRAMLGHEGDLYHWECGHEHTVRCKSFRRSLECHYYDGEGP
jgi:hypothetical protein